MNVKKILCFNFKNFDKEITLDLSADAMTSIPIASKTRL